MSKKNVLVSGASIAGLTLAYWLQQYGFNVVIVERSAELRLGGQNIDVKGPGYEVIKLMGLDKKIKAANTTEVGIQFVNTRNKILAEFSKDDALSMTQELEILRGDLVTILHEKLNKNTDIRFGDRINAINDTEKDVEVHFESGKQEHFDLVIIAEGNWLCNKAISVWEDGELCLPGHLHGLFYHTKRQKRTAAGHAGAIPLVVLCF